jgi:hypothetical protein
MIFSLFRFLLLSLAISKYRQYFLLLQALRLNNEKWKKSSFFEEKKFGRIDSSTGKVAETYSFSTEFIMNFET